jgi:hypothetical protein
MLLTNRRVGLIYFCLAGMEMAWFTPIFLLLHRPAGDIPAWAVFLGLSGTLLAFMLLVELLNVLEIDWPFYELAVIGSIVVGSLLFVRVWLYWSMPAGNFTWLANTLGALFEFYRGLRPELLLLLTSLFLWQRAASATSRDLGFFSVGLSFRLGLLLLIVGAGLLSAIRGQSAIGVLWIYLALGLSAVALARTYEKASGARSAGALPSPGRLAQMFLAVGATVGLSAGLSAFYTPNAIKKALLAILKPLWTLLYPALDLLVRALFWLLTPLLNALEWLLRRLAENLDWTLLEDLASALQAGAPPEELAEPGQSLLAGLPPWLWTGLRFILILLAVAVLVGMVLLFLDRVQRRRDRREREEAEAEAMTLGGASLERGARWLRDLAGLVRRFGLSRQLLAAISVQNIYANLCRLARQRGYPRRPAQPPDGYLPVLVQAFAGHDEALGRITAAYMQVHYGDQPVSPSELARLRRDYQEVRSSS